LFIHQRKVCSDAFTESLSIAFCGSLKIVFFFQKKIKSLKLCDGATWQEGKERQAFAGGQRVSPPCCEDPPRSVVWVVCHWHRTRHNNCVGERACQLHQEKISSDLRGGVDTPLKAISACR